MSGPSSFRYEHRFPSEAYFPPPGKAPWAPASPFLPSYRKRSSNFSRWATPSLMLWASPATFSLAEAVSAVARLMF